MADLSVLRGGFMGFLRFFLSGNGKEFAKLVRKFLAIKDPINTPAGFKERVKVALEILRVAVTFSETEVDDTIVETIGEILENEALLDFIAGLIGARATAPVAMSDNEMWSLTFANEGTDVQLKSVTTAGIDIAMWYEIVRMVLALIRTIR
jgi:hypothetical protein